MPVSSGYVQSDTIEGRFSLRHLTLGTLITSIVEFLESTKDDVDVIRFTTLIIIMNDATCVT